MTDRMQAPDAALSLSYDLARADLAAFFEHVACRPENLRRARRCVFAGAALAPVLTLAIGVLLEGDRFDLMRWIPGPALVPSAFLLALLLVVRPLQRWGARLALGRQLRGIAPGLMLGRMRLDIGPQGLLLVKPGGEARFAWDSVSGIEDAPGQVFIMLGRLMAIVVPIRGIAARDVDALRAAVRRHAGATAPDAATGL
jgi:hypothetical protein